MNNDTRNPYLRFTVLIAIVQLVSIASILWLMLESSNRTGKDAWIVFYAIIPAILINVTAPINLISGLYYFIKYRDDELEFKIIVGLAFISSILYLFSASG